MSSQISPRVLVFHSHGVGQTIELKNLPRNGETAWSDRWEIGYDGGKGSNAATALARLGVPTAFFGKVGTDLWGDIGLNWMEEAGVDLSPLLRDSSVHTLIGVVLVDQAGNNSIILGGDHASFTQEEITSTLDRYRKSEIFVTGFEIAVDSALTGAAYAKRLGMFTILNPSPVADYDIGSLPFVDLLIVNETEAEMMLEVKNQIMPSDPEDAVRQLHTAYEVPQIVLTLGGEGCAGFDRRCSFSLPAVPVTPVDTSGAGDAFLAALTYRLLEGDSLENACAWASRYAARTVTVRGTFPAFPLLSEMKEN